MKKLLTIVSVCALAAISIVGCGSKKESKEEVIKAMITANSNLKEVAATYTIKVGASVEAKGASQSINADVKGDIVTLANQKSKLTFSTEVMGRKVAMEVYSLKEGDKYMSYVSLNGKWQKTEVKGFNGNEAQVKKLKELISSIFLGKNVTFVEKDDQEINGKTYYVYEGKMTKAMMKEFFVGIEKELLSNLKNFSLTKIDEVLNSMPDIPYTIWIDQDTKLVYKLDVSFAKMLTSLIEKQLQAVKNTGTNPLANAAVKISAFDCSFVYNKTKDVPDFNLPDAAKSATEASSSLLNQTNQ